MFPSPSPCAAAKVPISHTLLGQAQDWFPVKQLAQRLSSQGISLGKVCFLVFLPFQWLPKPSQPPAQAQPNPGLPGGPPAPAQGTTVPKACALAQPSTQPHVGQGRSCFGPQPCWGHPPAHQHIPQPCCAPLPPSSPRSSFGAHTGFGGSRARTRQGRGVGLAGLGHGCVRTSNAHRAFTALIPQLRSPIVTLCSGEITSCAK